MARKTNLTEPFLKPLQYTHHSCPVHLHSEEYEYDNHQNIFLLKTKGGTVCPHRFNTILFLTSSLRPFPGRKKGTVAQEYDFLTGLRIPSLLAALFFTPRSQTPLTALYRPFNFFLNHS